MGKLSTYAKNKFLDHISGRAQFAFTTVHLALYNGDPETTGTEVTTPGTDGYARQVATMNAAESGVIDNSTAVTWGPASVEWGECSYIAGFDAATGGNLLFLDDIAVPKTVAVGDYFQIDAGNLVLTATETP